MDISYSDGMGGFLYIDRCKDDDDFIDIRLEDEQEDGSYIKVNTSLHKDDIKSLIEELKSLINSNE